MNTKTCISNDTVDVLTDAETPMYTETNFTAAAFNDLPDVLALASTKMFLSRRCPRRPAGCCDLSEYQGALYR
jgi:hypothetical protein